MSSRIKLLTPITATDKSIKMAIGLIPMESGYPICPQCKRKAKNCQPFDPDMPPLCSECDPNGLKQCPPDADPVLWAKTIMEIENPFPE